MGFKRIVVLFAQKYGEKWAAFPLFAADLVKSDRLLLVLGIVVFFAATRPEKTIGNELAHTWPKSGR